MVSALAILILFQANTVSLNKYVQLNEMVLVEFWGTWCPSCRKDFDKTLVAARKYPKAKVLMIALSDNQHDVRLFLKGKKIPDNVLIVIWKGASPVKTVPRFWAYYRGRKILETDSLDKLRKALE